MVCAGRVHAGACAVASRARRGGQARLVAGDRGCLTGRCKKGGEQIARTLRGTPGSRFHLAVDRHGLPLEIRLAAGNENEQRHLIPLIDALAKRGIHPVEVCADRGYDAAAIRQQLAERAIHARISKRRRAGDPIPPGTQTREIVRGRKRYIKVPDPLARDRFPIERTNAWLKAKRRIATRRDRKATNYLAFLHLAMLITLNNAF
jgi:transposase